ncbi:MAG: hypothetical protein IPP44_14840 [Ideonella sp.]|nr:hypothetical protein [Ideonella sp.]
MLRVQRFGQGHGAIGRGHQHQMARAQPPTPHAQWPAGAAGASSTTRPRSASGKAR